MQVDWEILFKYEEIISYDVIWADFTFKFFPNHILKSHEIWHGYSLGHPEQESSVNVM